LAYLALKNRDALQAASIAALRDVIAREKSRRICFYVKRAIGFNRDVDHENMRCSVSRS
jgi:hypothetical protein